MKKFSTWKLMLLLITILGGYGALALGITTIATFSDWKILNDESLETYEQGSPYETIIFLKPKDDIEFSVDNLTNWKAEVERLMTITESVTDSPKITKCSFSLNFLENTDVKAYPILITFENLPEVNVNKKVNPLIIEYTQTIFNPLSLLPESTDFDYAIMYTFERHHSYANTELITQDDTSSYYTYTWQTTEPIIVKNLYGNRLLPYILILLAAPAVGLACYFGSRYCDCKKNKNTLQ